MMAFCARLSLAADTIFIALVIFCVDSTEAILIRISFKLAISYYSSYFLTTSLQTASSSPIISSLIFPLFSSLRSASWPS